MARVQDGLDRGGAGRVVAKNVDAALREGFRGLPGGSSLTQLLAERRGSEHERLPPRTEEQIMAWADAHHANRVLAPSRHGPGLGGSRRDLAGDRRDLECAANADDPAACLCPVSRPRARCASKALPPVTQEFLSEESRGFCHSASSITEECPFLLFPLRRNPRVDDLPGW